ncbi:tetratricopeptide repeat protein [Mediterranea massiliensis]|uniref:tetratricopeptide repeat protein n=1 Tax=Mediterranea massiliensis TaxID=1841865 RepID=UPI0025A49885|nr:tetratricopeptide repeat protein [Mediterranea massiliensis]MDM8336437.1 tetratricopeptide repeat protein [Mediterranea massiliensis]
MQTKKSILQAIGMLCLLLTLAACGHKPLPHILLTVDSLASAAPDSAVTLLKQPEVKSALTSQDAAMYYQLLTVKAADKAYLLHTTDSVILRVVDYYERKQDKQHLPEAYYYAGRVYRDLGDAPQALDYFERAIQALPEGEASILKGKIYSQTGTLFLYQDMYEEALKMFKLSYDCDIKLKNIHGQIFNLRDIAEAYRGNSQIDSAIYYFQKASQVAEANGQTGNMYMVQTQLTSLYLQLGEYDLAQKAFEYGKQHRHKASRSGVYSIAAKLYYHTGKTDSAIYCFKQLLDFGTIYSKQTAHRYLAQIAIQNKNVKEALAHINSYISCTDSIQRITDTETLRKMHALYNYKLRENENIRLKAENERKQTYIYYTLAISGILLSLGFGYLQYNRRKKTELSLQLEKTKRLKEEIQQKSEQFIKENESKIALLEKQLKESDNTLKQQLEAQREKMVYENKLAQAALDRQNQISKIIEESDIKKDIMRKLHDGDNNKNLLTEKDWKDIEAKIEENFPGFKIRLFDLYSRLSEHEYKICLLLKLEFKPIEIASLTLHSKESVASTRRRLYEKVFKCKGSPNDWDEIIRAI